MDVLLPALVCAVLGGVAGWFVPRLIARVPEPVPEPDAEPATVPEGAPEPKEPPRVKELYADVARIRGLAPGSAVAAAVVAGIFGASVGWAWPLVYLVPLAPMFVALGVIDFRTKLLPTWLLAPTYPVLVLAVVLCGVVTQDWHDLRRAGLGWLVMGSYYVFLWLVSPRIMGYGDVRLAGLLGMALGYLGWGELFVGMNAAFLVAGVVALAAVVSRNASFRKMSLAFGPWMLVSAVAGVAFGHAFGQWYLRSQGLSA
jgi:leader peptidase (prepilin peptidase)/N-methyltransferase